MFVSMQLNHKYLLLYFFLLASCQKKETTKEVKITQEKTPNVQILGMEKEDHITIKEVKILPNGRIAIEDTKRELLYNDFLRKYYRLMEFKNEAAFIRYGFGSDNSYRYWIREVRKTIKEEDSKLLFEWGLSFKELENLATSYALSASKETPATTEINNRFQAIFEQIRRPKYEAALIDYNLETPFDTTINILKERILAYQSRISALSDLYDVYYEKRDSIRQFFGRCQSYFELMSKLNVMKQPQVDSIKNAMMTYGSVLTSNQQFINTLLLTDVDTTVLAFERPLAPIIHYPSLLPGIYAIDDDYANRNNFPNPVAREAAILKQSDYSESNDSLYFSSQLEKVVYLKGALDSINESRKTIYVYSKNQSYKTQVSRLGRYASECDNGFFHYDLTIDSTVLQADKLLFSSTFPLDLIFENDPKIDSLIYTKYPGVCVDCPGSSEFQTTFAQLDGFENLYFTYAYEEGLEIDKVDNPVRSLIYIKDDFFFYLWSESIDNFGCSCL